MEAISTNALSAKLREAFASLAAGIKDDPIHLLPHFTKEETRLFKQQPDVMLLHVELEAELGAVRELAKIKYPRLLTGEGEVVGDGGEEAYTISRDLLVP